MRIPILLSLTLAAALALSVGGCRGMQTGVPGGANVAASGGTTQLPPTQSAVKRIIVVILQNNSFDHLFGTFPGVDGIRPGVAGYSQLDATGNTVTPFLLTNLAPKALPEGRTVYLADIDNGLMDKYAATEGAVSMGYYDNTIAGIDTLWSYAQQYALADNYFQSVIGEAPTNQLYMVAADDNNVVHPVQPAFGPCNLPDKFAQPYNFPHVGDQLTSKSIAWEMFQENYGMCGYMNPLHDPFQYFVDTNNTSHIQDVSQFFAEVQNGTLPAVSFVIPGPGHDFHPAQGASVLVAATWLKNLVQQVQSSPIWSSTAIVITFDTGGGWYDHVPPPQVDAQGLGSRVPLLVVSPLAKVGYISHVRMDHVSILKYIQWNWMLPSLNGRNDQSNDIRDMFQ